MKTLIKENFKELLNLFVSRPWVGLVFFFIWSTTFFMNKWIDYQKECKEEIAILTSKTFNNLLLLQQERTKLELERRSMDSLYRAKLEESINKMINGK